MKDEKKTKKQLIAELEELRHAMATMPHPHLTGAGMAKAHAVQDFHGRFFSFVNKAPHQVLITDSGSPDNPVIIEANPAACSLHGYGRQDLVGMPLFSFFTIRSRPALLTSMMKVMEGHQESFEAECLRRDGTVFPVLLTAGLIMDGAVPVVYIIERNIAGQKKAEEAYLHSERQLANLLGNIPGMAYRCRNDRSWTMEFVSGGCFELTGYKTSELLQNAKVSFADLIHPDDREKVWNEVQTALRQQSRFQIEYRIIAAGGREKEVWERGVGVYQGTNILFIEGLITDVTAHKQTEKALRASEKKYRTYIENAPESIFVLDENGHHKEVNAAAETLTGHTGRELLRMKFSDLADRQEAGHAARLFERLATEGVVNAEFLLKRKNGTPVHIAMHAVRLSDTDCLAFCSDITERIHAEQALRESEEKYRFLFDNILLGIGIVSPDGAILIMNTAMKKITGHGQGKSDQANIRDFSINPEDALLLCSLSKKRKAVHNFEVQFRRKDGKPRWASCAVKPIHYGGNDAFLLSCLDITERKHAEEQYRKLSVAVEQSPVTIVITDREGNIEYVNPCFSKTTGYSAEEVIGEKPSILKSGEQPPAFYQKLWQTILRGEIWYGEFHNRKKNGELFWEKVTIGPITDLKGNITHFIALKEDITERKFIEQALRESEEKYRGLVETSIHGVIIAQDNPLRIAFASKPMKAILGYQPEELEQMTSGKILEVVYPDDRRIFFERFRQRLAGDGKNPPGEYRLYHKNGSIRWVEVFSTRIDYLNAPATLTVFVDITEYRKVENEKKVLEEQLAIARKMETIGTLASGIAHDFNNIMTPVLGYAEMARMRMANDTPVSRYLDSIIKAAHRAKTLVSQILTFNSQTEMTRQPVSLGIVVDEALKLLRPSIPDNITVQLKTGEDVGRILADSSRLYQIVVNICNNAVQAMQPDGGVLGITIGQIRADRKCARLISGLMAGATYVCLTVTDTGKGMDAAILERIFEPFFTTKPVDKGTGLGLSVVHGIIRSHDGAISVKSRPGKGSEFRVYFPVPEPVLPKTFQEPEPDISGSEKVLVVDDEQSVTDTLQQMLLQLGFKATVCNKAAGALDLVLDGRTGFDLVITNLSMPGMNGLELAERIHNVLPDLPILLITGDANSMTKEKAESCGIKALLVKPVSFNELAYGIRKSIYH